MMAILEMRNVSCTINEQAILDRLNVEFWQGHIHAVVGPNGAGKSTLAAVVMGLSGYREIEGEVLFKGKSINDLSVDERARQGVTLAWQEPARFEGLLARDFIMAGAREKTLQAVQEVLDEVGLDPDKYLTRRVDKTLSGGERKKIELASILAMQPEVALLDEPDSGIDIESIERIFEAVRVLKEKGTTVILITHSLAVLNQAEHAFLMCKGQIVDKGYVDRIGQYFENKCISCPHKRQPDPEIRGMAV
jgi:Fe-S cluster assembly ATP-binding protein